MADLLSAHNTKFVSVARGENIEGIITKLTSHEILVDIGAKTEAVVLEKDKNLMISLLHTLKVGDKVTVSVLNPESDEGYTVVSLRRFIEEKIWDRADRLAKEKTPMEITIDESTKGGYVVSGDGIAGFLPNSHMIHQASENVVGNKIKASILEVNRELKKIIFSQKGNVSVKDFEDAAAKFKEGEVVVGTVSNVAPFGIFLFMESSTDLPIEGFIYQNEISWDGVENIQELYKSGEKIEAKVLGLDRENKRVNLSIKRLTADPFEEVMSQFAKDKRVSGKITKVNSSGVTLDLGDGVLGIIKKEKVPLNTDFQVGQELNATVVDVEASRHRVILVPVLLEKPIGYR